MPINILQTGMFPSLPILSRLKYPSGPAAHRRRPWGAGGGGGQFSTMIFNTLRVRTISLRKVAPRSCGGHLTKTVPFEMGGRRIVGFSSPDDVHGQHGLKYLVSSSGDRGVQAVRGALSRGERDLHRSLGLLCEHEAAKPPPQGSLRRPVGEVVQGVQPVTGTDKHPGCVDVVFSATPVFVDPTPITIIGGTSTRSVGRTRLSVWTCVPTTRSRFLPIFGHTSLPKYRYTVS